MAKTAKSRRKAAKKRKDAKRIPPRQRDRDLVRRAGEFPVLEVLVSREWEHPEEIVQILVARQLPDGRVLAGAFVVDLACLGVKSALARVLAHVPAYRREIRANVTEYQEMFAAELDLVAKIVREGIAWAHSLGFEPDSDFEEAKHLLDGANPDAVEAEVPLGGDDGKPLYIPGPFDPVREILARLERRLGPDGYRFLPL